MSTRKYYSQTTVIDGVVWQWDSERLRWVSGEGWSLHWETNAWRLETPDGWIMVMDDLPNRDAAMKEAASIIKTVEGKEGER